MLIIFQYDQCALNGKGCGRKKLSPDPGFILTFRMAEGWNNSTVALRVAEDDDEK